MYIGSLYTRKWMIYHTLALNWIPAWLTGRAQSVKIPNFFSSFKSVLSGILQGSVLGPLLFLLFINDLCDSISLAVHPTFLADYLKLFTDDIPISSDFLPVYVYSPLLHNSPNYLLSWSELRQLTISVPKCSIFFLFPILNLLNIVSILLAL